MIATPKLSLSRRLGCHVDVEAVQPGRHLAVRHLARKRDALAQPQRIDARLQRRAFGAVTHQQQAQAPAQFRWQRRRLAQQRGERVDQRVDAVLVGQRLHRADRDRAAIAPLRHGDETIALHAERCDVDLADVGHEPAHLCRHHMAGRRDTVRMPQVVAHDATGNGGLVGKVVHVGAPYRQQAGATATQRSQRAVTRCVVAIDQVGAVVAQGAACRRCIEEVALVAFEEQHLQANAARDGPLARRVLRQQQQVDPAGSEARDPALGVHDAGGGHEGDFHVDLRRHDSAGNATRTPMTSTSQGVSNQR
ncbi:MAG: hypothetical protein QM792_06950 [Piscinibacter sp.]